MATKFQNKKNVKGTRVICSNCGAEIIIPDHEQMVAGMAIGKDSGLGTVVLPTQQKKSFAGELANFISEHSEMFEAVSAIMGQIEECGYVDVEGVVRRWIPSQCLAMVNSTSGFHKSLVARGHKYSWTVLLADLKRQSELEKQQDVEGIADRNRWYNKKLAVEMAKYYLEGLTEHINSLPEHSHKGRKYIKLVVNNVNKGRGVHVDEVQVIVGQLSTLINKIKMAKNSPSYVYTATKAFYEAMRSIHWCPEKPCNEFINAYKAAGAYYTMKDLIMFENCFIKSTADNETEFVPTWRTPDARKFRNMEESLELLECRAANLVEQGVTEYGYEMLGFLKDFMEYNKFNYANAKENWKNQSELRKAARMLNRNNRRNRK